MYDVPDKEVHIDGHDIDIAQLFYIDEDNLTKEFARQSALYAYYATLQAELERQAAATSVGKDKMYARKDIIWRKWHEKRDQKYTETVIRSRVIQDEEYNSYLTLHMRAQEELDLCKAIVRALQQRAEMLISMGAHLRQEYSMTGMTIKQKEYDAAVADAKAVVSKRRRRE